MYVPSKELLLQQDAFLFAVYGLTPEKVKEMKLSDIDKKLEEGKKDITWFQAYKFRSLLESKPKTSLWKRIISKIKY